LLPEEQPQVCTPEDCISLALEKIQLCLEIFGSGRLDRAGVLETRRSNGVKEKTR
jgi:hypothetical protein